MTEPGIVTQQVRVCLLCGGDGKPLYERLSDRLFDAPGEWGHLQCPDCGLVWLNPRPVPIDLHKVYKTYYTHRERPQLSSIREKAKRGLYSTVPGYERLGSGWIWREVGRVLTRIPLFRERALLGTMCLSGEKRGVLLDIGCGDGAFLSIMRDAGWEVMGIEPDQVAAKVAQEGRRVPVIGTSLEGAEIEDQSIDVITLSHVIEHVHDPVTLLAQCRRVMSPHGKVVIVTPNIGSTGHKTFGSSWGHLDPPRHLYLFSSRTLRACCERAGLQVELLRTSARSARWIWALSTTIKHRNGVKRKSNPSGGASVRALMFQLRENISLETHGDAGEELVVIAVPESHSKTGPMEAGLNDSRRAQQFA